MTEFHRCLGLCLLVCSGAPFLGAVVAETDGTTADVETAQTAAAAEPDPAIAVPDEDAEPQLFERVRVSGTPDKIRNIPGSVTYLDQERLAEQDYSDVHRILSQVPGVHVQEEDGYGLRPNIGMRGSGSERSSKITVMEDGVLIAPAPYSAPSAYYFPTAGRMEGIEVRKGSSSIQYGPLTNGGVINFISSGIPSSFGGKLDLAAGDDDTLRGKFKIGASGERFGWLFESYRMQTDGFKQLDTGGETGFELQDYLVKLRFTSRPGARRFQALEIKAGITKQLGDETYLGLTEADFRVTPFRRYAASQEDRLNSDHDQLQARYLVQLQRQVDLTLTAYRNDFFRNWRKLEAVAITSPTCTPGQGLGGVLSHPLECPEELALLRGELAADSADDALTVRNNRRDYDSQGLHAILGWTPQGRRTSHDVELGLRYHEDAEDRFQEQDGFRMTAARRMERTSSGAPGSQSNRISSAESLAVFVKDSITRGKWSVTPGVRFERILFRSSDYADAARTVVTGTPHGNRLDEWIPGIGVSYALDNSSSLFGGIHRGFAPPGPRSASRRAEESTNYELGYRGTAAQVTLETTGFFNDYANLLGTCTVSSGCSSADVGDVFDGGAVRVYGLEAALEHDRSLRGGALTLPLHANYTYTRGEFRSSFASAYEPWGDVAAGDELPYLPRHQLTFGAGLVHQRASVQVNLIYVDEQRTLAGRGPLAPSDSAGAHLLVDLAATVRWTAGLRGFAQIRNLTDEIYVAARRPAGARPGIDRTFLAGLAYEF